MDCPAGRGTVTHGLLIISTLQYPVALRVMLSGTPQHDFVLFCRDERDMHPTREALGQAGLDTAGPMLTSLAGLKGRRTDVCW